MIKLDFTLTEDEIAETLLCLNFKREGRFKRWNVYAISLIGIGLLIAYARHPERLYVFWALLVTVFILFYILYGRPLMRKLKAKKMARVGGVYRLTLSDTRLIFGDTEESCELDSKCRIMESETVYTINTAKEVFCIPKRALSQADRAELEEILGKVKCKKELLKTKG